MYLFKSQRREGNGVDSQAVHIRSPFRTKIVNICKTLHSLYSVETGIFNMLLQQNKYSSVQNFI